MQIEVVSTSEGAASETFEDVPATGVVPQSSTEVISTEGGASEGAGEFVLAGEGVLEAGVEVVSVGSGASKDGAKSRSIPSAPQAKTAGKRALPVEIPPAAPASKRARPPRLATPALPSLERGKAPLGLLTFAPGDGVLNADEITPQSPASIVVHLLRERMFGSQCITSR